MSRAGRKRKAGNRYPNGQVRREDWKGRRDVFLSLVLGDCLAIYVIELEGSGAVKIGYSNYPEARARTLNVGQACNMQLCWYIWLRKHDAIKVERAIHDKLKGQPCHAKGEVYYFDVETAKGVIEAVIEKLKLESWPEEIFRSDQAFRGWKANKIRAWRAQ